MKKAVSLILAALTLSATMVSCSGSDDLLTRKYNYDLSEYITLGDYKNLSAQGYKYEVTDEEVQQQVLATRSYYARATDITDRPAQQGDIVYVDYTGTIDGAEFEGGSDKDYEVTIGVGALPFEDTLIGRNPGETYTATVTLPDPYPSYPEHSGKEVVFEVYVDSIMELELPVYSDDFARAYLGHDSTADFEKHVRTLLEDHYNAVFLEYVDSQTWPLLMDSTTVIKYPEDELEDMYNSIITSNPAYAEAMGLNLEPYIEVNYGLTLEEFYAEVRAECESMIKQEMICYAIARQENLSLSEEEYQTRALDYAINTYNLNSVAAFENIFDKEVIRQTILFDLVHECVVDYADITYPN